MKHGKYKSRKNRKRALHVRQYGSDNDAPGSVQANRMIGNVNPLPAIDGAIAAAIASILAMRGRARRGGSS